MIGRSVIIRGMSQEEQYTGSSEVLVEVTRGRLVESVHRGFIAVVDGDGAPVARLGDVETRTWFRSAAKPFQCIPLISSGAADHYRLDPAELAVINGSHSGEECHLEAVRSILRKAGIDESALKCGAHMPFDDATARRMRSAGVHPGVLHNNCSGKHAGMLALARYLSHPLENYIDPRHPIQREILKVVSAFTCVPAHSIAIAIDGCSAPVFGAGMEDMARGYARLAACDLIEFGDDIRRAARRVVDSMVSHPEMVGGNHNRLDTDLMRATGGGVISKVGAEGVQLIGIRPCERYPRGLGVAIKIEDGDIRRSRDPVVIETLRQLGILGPELLSALAPYAHSKVHNHRRLEVGEVRACFTLID